MRDNSRTLKVTPAGASFLRFIAVINSGDINVMRNYANKNIADPLLQEVDAETIANHLYEIHLETGGMRVHKVFLSQDAYVMIVMEAIGDGVLYLDKLKVEEEKPYRVLEYAHQQFDPAHALV